MDGDGRPDLVVGESQAWHRNEGDGFGEGRALPAWWPVLSVGADGHTSAALSVGRTRQAVAVPAVPPLPYDPSATSPKGGFHQQMLQVVDLDRDGMPDLVDRRSPSAPVVQWSRGVRGGLLAAVVLGAGAETTLEYTSSSELAPSGTDAPQHAALRKDVLTAVEVWDPVTGYGARRESTYAGGWSSGVRWWGFEEARHDEYVWGEPDVTTSAPIPAWQWLGAEETGAWVGRDVVLVESRSVWTDRALGYLDGGAAEPYLRLEQSYGYTAAGWPERVTTTWWDEVRSDPAHVPTSATDGGPPTHSDRGPPRTPADGDPPSPRGPGVPPPEQTP